MIRFFSLLLFCVFMSAPAFATELASDDPVFVEADGMYHNKNSKTVSAKGKVKIEQSGRTLYADEVVYDQQQDKIIAKGNVEIVEPTGDTFYSNEIILTDRMSKGEADALKARFSDGSLMASKKGRRINEHVFILEDAAYTPCTICTEGDKQETPFWQIRASEVTYDEEAQNVSYRHPRFEIYGTPVLYLPYFSHPSPEVKRKTGFLAPKYGSSSVLGTTFETPFFWNIAQNMDATFSPIFTSDQGPILKGEFRHVTENGRYELEGSITNPDEVDEAGRPTGRSDIRGHVEGWGQFFLDNGWEWGFSSKRATDDTYLRRYEFGDEDDLTTRLYTQQLERRDYITAQALSFQGLQAGDDPGKTPLVLPLIDVHHEMSAGDHGERFFFDGNTMVLYRDEGPESRRLSMKSGWRSPHISNDGQLTTLTASLRGDVYSVENVMNPADPTGETLEGSAGRVVPELMFDWNYPLIRRDDGYRIVIQPTANIIVSPYGNNPDKIPNEDSVEVEISDDNLFNANHFTGLDRLEGGPRTNYGMRAGIYADSGESLQFLFGQNYRVREDNNFTEETGMADNFSDYVGRVGFSSGELLDIAYRFRFDEEDFHNNRSEVWSSLNLDPVRLNVNYLILDDISDTFPTREEIGGGVDLKLNDQWRFTAGGRRDITDNGGMINAGTGIIYTGDCTDFTLAWSRDFIRDRDIEPSTSITFQVTLKNLN
jgi:LPS-assembly protein